jgi:hypothetical protein
MISSKVSIHSITAAAQLEAALAKIRMSQFYLNRGKNR